MIDTYTKIVLTIIGVTLIGLLLQPIYLPEPVTAREIIAINIVEVGGSRVYSTLPVRIKK
jgi:hypothetical protein